MLSIGKRIGNYRKAALVAFYSTKSLNVVFFGSDTVSRPTLQLLFNDYYREDGLINSLSVICTADKKDKHGKTLIPSPVRMFCEKNAIPCTVIPQMKQHNLHNWIPPSDVTEKKFNLCVVASFGYFIPSNVISCFKEGGINMHPSLLPKYRGPAPIHHAILNGDKQTGVSVITLSDKLIDGGKILYQKTVDIDPMAHYPLLSSQLAFEGAMAVMDTIYNIDLIQPTVQNESDATSAPKITKEMAYVDFSKQDSEKVFSLYKALNYQYPLRCVWNNQVVFLRSLFPIDEKHERKVLPEANHYPAGTVLYIKKWKSLIIRCKDDWINCDEIQIMPKSKSFSAAIVGNQFNDEKQIFQVFDGYTNETQ